jgi:hypothetical protein
MKGARCGDSGCGAAIVWVRTRAGKMMPLDDTVELRAALLLRPGARFEDLQHAEMGERGLMPHWATCPGAESFRAKRGPAIERGRGKVGRR